MIKCRKIMLFLILIVAFFAYSVVIYTHGTAKPPDMLPMSESAVEGKKIWQQLNCIACHQLYGLGGHMGPDLTNVISAPGKGEAFAAAFIKGGTRSMPGYALDNDELEALIEYLKYVDQTGNWPLHDASITWYGSFKIN